MAQFIIAHSIDDERTKDVLIEDNVSFQTMFLSPKCLEGLTKCGFQKPSPIQLKAIPLGRCGFDLMMKSKSGTGKTLVFSVLALEMIDISSPNLQVLVLAPTREIAVQNADTMKAVGSSLTGLAVHSFIGGLPEKDDIDKARNCQIAVGAPGRIKSLIKQNILNIDSVKLFVLDEADKLLETSFLNDVNEIYSSLPLKKQIVAASATYPENLKNFLSNYMQSPTHVSAENDTQLLLGLKHFVREVKTSSNVAQVMKYKNEELLKLLANISFTQCIIFSNYQTRAENVSISINRHGWNSLFISAAQTQQKRLEVIDNLRKFKCRILLSTDLTARGIDVSNVDLVINYDIPIDVSTYLHRMGRAGRYGSKGVCISLVSGEKDLLQIRKYLGNIGGTNLSISKLDNVENGVGDLWTVDESKFEKISGIIVKNEDITETIKKEVLSLKNCSQVLDDSSETTEKPKKTKQNKKQKNNSDHSEDIRDMDAKLDSKKKPVHSDCLEALAEATFEFIDIPSPSISPSIEMSGFSDKVDEGEAMDLNENKDTQSILKSLAEGTFDFENIPSPANELDGQNTKLSSTAKSSELGTDIDDKKCKNEVFIKNKGIFEVAKILNNHTDTNSDMETNVSNYLKIIDQPPIDSLKTTKEIEIPQENTTEKNLELERNHLSDPNNIFSCAYLHNIEKSSDNWKNLVKKDVMSQMNIDKSVEDEPMEEEYGEEPEEAYDEEMEGDYEEAEDFAQVEYDENGYENIPNRMVWVPVEESSSVKNVEVPHVNLLEDKKNSPGEVEAVNTNEPNFTQYWEDIPSRIEPVQESSLGRNINDCFQECSNELWLKSLHFPTTEEFEIWFDKEWSAKVAKVRQYALKNFYVREMSSYQHEKQKF